MNDKVEWEVVDAEAHDGRHRAPPPPLTPQQALQAMLGPWWRWKLAALFVAGGIVLLLVTAIAGVLVVTAIAFALLAFAVVRVRNWWRGAPASQPGRRP